MSPALTLPGEQLVFVYGTLRAGGRHDIRRLTPAPRFLGRARVHGCLFDLGAYPGLRLGGAHWVQGEVYAITPPLEAELDHIEEVWPQCSGEYLKQVARVTLLPEGASPLVVSCLLYELHPARTEGLALIASGDWMARS